MGHEEVVGSSTQEVNWENRRNRRRRDDERLDLVILPGRTGKPVDREMAEISLLVDNIGRPSARQVGE